MAQLVWVDGLLNPGDLCVMADQLPDACRGEGVSTHGEKDLPAGFRRDKLGSGIAQVKLQCLECGSADGNQPGLVPLSSDPNDTTLLIEILEADATGFGDAQTAGIEKFQQCAIADF